MTKTRVGLLVLFGLVCGVAPTIAGPGVTNTCTLGCNGLDSASVITGSFICRDGSGNLVIDGVSQGPYLPGALVLGTFNDNLVILPDTNDVVYTGGGNDTICTDGGDDFIAADDPTFAPGTDWVDAGAGGDQVYTGNSDTPGTAPDDQVLGGADADFIFTGNGYDAIDAGEGANVICSNGGNDVLDSGAGADLIIAGDGDDDVDSGDGADFVLGGSGTNTVITDAEDDRSSPAPAMTPWTARPARWTRASTPAAPTRSRTAR